MEDARASTAVTGVDLKPEPLRVVAHARSVWIV